MARLLRPFDFDDPYNVSATLAVARQLGPFALDDPYSVLTPLAVVRQLDAAAHGGTHAAGGVTRIPNGEASQKL